jgi:predicted DNA-binding transcriptional regulator AlpA
MTNTTEALDPVLSRRDVKNYLGISEQTLRRIIAAGKLTKLQLSSRKIGFLQSDVVNYLAAARGAI